MKREGKLILPMEIFQDRTSNGRVEIFFLPDELILPQDVSTINSSVHRNS